MSVVKKLVRALASIAAELTSHLYSKPTSSIVEISMDEGATACSDSPSGNLRSGDGRGGLGARIDDKGSNPKEFESCVKRHVSQLDVCW